MSQEQAVHLNMLSEDMLSSKGPSAQGISGSKAGDPQTVVSDVQKRWALCLALFKEELPTQTIHTWFSPIIPVFFVDNILFLRGPSRFFCEWIEKNQRHTLLQAVQQIFGEHTRVEFLVAAGEGAFGDDSPMLAHPLTDSPDLEIPEIFGTADGVGKK